MRIPPFRNSIVSISKMVIVQESRISLIATRVPATPGNALASAVTAAWMHTTTPANSRDVPQ